MVYEWRRTGGTGIQLHESARQGGRSMKPWGALAGGFSLGDGGKVRLFAFHHERKLPLLASLNLLYDELKIVGLRYDDKH
jgi:hypothetical protein